MFSKETYSYGYAYRYHLISLKCFGHVSRRRPRSRQMADGRKIGLQKLQLILSGHLQDSHIQHHRVNKILQKDAFYIS